MKKEINITIRGLVFCFALFLSLCCKAENREATSYSLKLKILEELTINEYQCFKEIDNDTVIQWINDVLPRLEKDKKYKYYFLFRLLYTRTSIRNGNFNLAINNAENFYNKAKEMNYELGIAFALNAMGEAYLSTSLFDKATECFRNALDIYHSNYYYKPFIKNTLYKKIFTKIEISNDSTVLHLINKFKKLSTKDKDDFLVYTCYAFYNIKKGDEKRARFYIEKTENLLKRFNYKYYQYIHRYIKAELYNIQKKYDKALAEYNAILLYIKEKDTHYYSNILGKKAEMLTKMGKYTETFNLYEEINAYKDSMNIESYPLRINELNALYQIDRKKLENQKNKRNIFFIGIIIASLLVVLTIVIILIIKKKNKQLKRSKQEQEKSKRKAELSVKAKSIFLSNMSHEIRTPLNALNGFSRILAEDEVDTATKQQCNNIILENSELLLKLIDEIIELSQLKVENIKLNIQRYDAINTCRNVIEMIKKVKQTNAEIVFQSNLNYLYIETDNARLQQILINLLINATKFTPDGKIFLRVALSEDKKDLVFSITDTGCGIPANKQDEIFNRFEKIHEDIEGSGLGLSICKIIVQKLNGDIWIDKSYQKGTKFVFTHPIFLNRIIRKEANND